MGRHVDVNIFRKEEEVRRQIAKASDDINRKHGMLKLEQKAAENILNETFKRIVTPLKTLVKLSEIPFKHW